MNAAFFALLRHELVLAWRQGSASGMAVAFFMVTVAMFPLGVGPAPNTLMIIAPGVIWVAALLSALLSLERMFNTDIEDGFMEQLVISSQPMEMVVGVKALGHWLVTGLPLVVASPILAVLMQMEWDAAVMLMVSLLLGTPGLSFIGAIGGALTAMVKKGGMLVALLILPLYVPTLIFGVSAVDAVMNGGNSSPHLMLLGALSLASVALAPFAAAAAIRLAVE